MARITSLRAEHRQQSHGIGSTAPRLSWIVAGAAPGDVQIGYEIEARGEVIAVEGTDSNLVAWPFAHLTSREVVAVRVRARLRSGEATDWSDELELEAGLLKRSDWAVDWVTPSTSAPAEGVRGTYLARATFTVDAPVVRARVYASAHGIYALEVNGIAPTDELLAPGWTSYGHRVRYQTYDVTPQLTAGQNAIGVELSDGWYRGRIGFHGGVWDNYGTDLAILLQLELTTADGTVTRVPLEHSWRWLPGPATASLYDGEAFDARLVPRGWSAGGYDDSAWQTPAIVPFDSFAADLVAPTGPPVRVTEVLRPVSVEKRENGRYRLDFGQNIAGLLRIRVSAPAGHTVTLHHAEVLENGELATRPLRGAPSVDSYTASGDGVEQWSPRFTVHGFRYAEVENWPAELGEGDVEAVVIHSDMQRSGWFQSSHPGLNRLHENVLWSMRDNFVDLPTDCPQRDERLGWTGDIQVFAPTAAFLYSSTGVLQSWLRDVAAEQKASGSVPNFVPWIECGFPSDASAAWGDAAVIVPWTIYERLGDVGILETQYESMKAWVDQITALARPNGLWSDGFQLGDWLDPAAPPESPGDSKTDKYLVSSAYQAHSTRLFAKAAAVLGKTVDAEHYAKLAQRTLVAFRDEYVTATGRVVSDTVTALALCLVFDLLPEQSMRDRAGKRLVELVAEGDYRIQTGFVGTPLVCDALAAVGAIDEAYHLLLQDQLPSWLYPVSMGATTIWERWDSMLPNGEVNPGEMTSFNHYALGAVADFMHRVVAGLAPAAPGYARVVFAPKPGGGLSSAEAAHDTPYGRASSAWSRDGDRFTLTVEVPTGATGVIRLPSGEPDIEVTSGTHTVDCDYRSIDRDPARPVRWNPHENQNNEKVA